MTNLQLFEMFLTEHNISSEHKRKSLTRNMLRVWKWFGINPNNIFEHITPEHLTMFGGQANKSPKDRMGIFTSYKLAEKFMSWNGYRP